MRCPKIFFTLDWFSVIRDEVFSIVKSIIFYEI
jgi:hypothetical protein